MSGDLPLVSIITPSFNSARFIAETLKSVAAQDYGRIEHIVVDGGSTDGTLDMLRPSPASWLSEPDRGQADALNKGLRRARGAIIGWLNADDTYAPGAVRAAVTHLAAHPDCGLAFADCDWIDEEGRVVDRWRTRPTTLTDLLLDGCIIPHQSAFLRREVFAATGEFDAGLRFAMDYDLLLRALRAFPGCRVKGAWGSLRVWAGTKTSQHQAAFWPENLRVVERALAAGDVPAEVAAEARRRVHLNLALAAAWAGDDAQSEPAFDAALVDGIPYGNWAALAEIIVTRCRRPSYLRVPTAEVEDRLDKVLSARGTPAELRAHVSQLRAFGAWLARDWAAARQYAGTALRASPAVRRNRGLWSVWARAWLRRGPRPVG